MIRLTKISRCWMLLVGPLFLLSIFFVALTPGSQTLQAASASPQAVFTTPLAAAVYLPLAVTPPKPPLVKLGVDFAQLITASDVLSSDLPVAKQMGTEWTRLELTWSQIEQRPGAFDWESFDRVITRTRALNLKVLAIINNSPTWASAEGCGVISDTVAMTTFLTLAIERYGDGVAAWEFINEPDGKHYLPDYGPGIGCWASHPNEYAQQLKLFYQTVKRLNPDALVLFGSLAYDNWELFDRQFLENVLKNPEGAYFDVVGLHYYPINPVDFPSIRNKIQEVRTTLSKYGLADKQVWVTETSMWSNGVAGLEGQKDYIVCEQTRALCNGADNLFWFAVRQQSEVMKLHRWLISLNHQPGQGYFTYQHFATRIKDSTCQGSYKNVPNGIEAYRFTGGAQAALYILWSNTTTQTVSLPASTTARIFDRDGMAQPTRIAQSGVVTMEIGLNPIFVVTDPTKR